MSRPPKFVNIDWPAGLTEKFLSLKPRPTIRELRCVIYSPGLVLRQLNSQNQYTRRGYVPDPDKPGWLKIIQQEAQKRIEVKIEIINSRGAPL